MIELETGLKTRVLIVNNSNVEINSDSEPFDDDAILPRRLLLPIIASHGFGAKDPKSKNHLSDHWLYPIYKCLYDYGSGTCNFPLHDSTPISCNRVNSTIMNDAIFYTSRGHGDTQGWQKTANDNYKQFTWENLAYDTIGNYK